MLQIPPFTNDSLPLQRETRDVLLKCIGFLQDDYLRHPTNHYPTSPNSTWCQALTHQVFLTGILCDLIRGLICSKQVIMRPLKRIFRGLSDHLSE